MKKIALGLVAGIVAPIVLQAGGVGVYVPYSFGMKKSGTYAGKYNDTTYVYNSDVTYDDELKNKAGLGIALATNVNQESVFGYKVAFELTNPEPDNSFKQAGDKYALIQTLEFGVVNSSAFKLWLGPRFDIAYETYDDGVVSMSGLEFGIAPALGINVGLGDSFALTFDVDYSFAWQGGSMTSPAFDAYDASVTGPSARLGVMFRWDEESYY